MGAELQVGLQFELPFQNAQIVTLFHSGAMEACSVVSEPTAQVASLR